MMRKRALVSVNIAVLLFGMAGLFAKWIHLPAICITFGRVLFSSAALGIYLLVRQRSIRVAARHAFLLVFAGAVLALHWWSFLGAIQLSTVAVGTITFSTFPLFVTLLEPVVFHRKPERRSVIIAVIILIGVLITVPEFSFENRMFLGILTGLVSAVSYAVLTLINKSLADKVSSTVTAFYEQAAAAVILLPFVAGMSVRPAASDVGLLLFLGIVTTALAHTLFINSLRALPAHLAGICSSLETVYGILFAMLLLREIPSAREVIGAVIIVGAVVAEETGETGAGSLSPKST